MVEKFVTKRFFGRTVIDSLDLNQNAWYIDEAQVTATAAQLNGASILPATSQTVDILNDDILFLDHSGSHVMGYDSIPDFVNLVCGSAASTGLASSGGVITVTPSTDVLGPSTDHFMYITAAGIPKKDAVSDVVSNITGDGLIATAGVISTADYGAFAVGSVRFTGVGDCDAVKVGSVLYTRDATPVVTDGEWTEGLNANASATNLAAGINGDTRNGGASYYVATVNTDTVHIYSKSVGGDVAVALTGAAPTEPSVRENLVEGRLVAPKQTVIAHHTVTANDVETAVLVNIPLPVAPAYYIAQIRDATGGILYAITDRFTIGATPNRIVLTGNGATHVVAGDTITIFAQE